jgi:hypothetical protein
VVEVLATLGDGHGKARHGHREHLLPERRHRWQRSSTAGKAGDDEGTLEALCEAVADSNGWPAFAFENLAQLRFLRDHANACGKMRPGFWR